MIDISAAEMYGFRHKSAARENKSRLISANDKIHGFR